MTFSQGPALRFESTDPRSLQSESFLSKGTDGIQAAFPAEPSLRHARTSWTCGSLWYPTELTQSLAFSLDSAHTSSLKIHN